MPLSNSVIRRYTPPTCTLEVLAQSSPLSKWMGKSVLKDLRFELRLDDPRLPEEGRIAIRGDRDQLEALHTAVSSYVQEFIHKSPENFREYYSPGNHSRGLGLDNQTLTDSSNNSSQTNTIIPFNRENSRSDIHLQPGQNLTHNLFLGSLAAHTSAPVIQLSLLQLFDLATALDEYSADVMALPNLNPGRVGRTSAIPTWAPMAAVAAVAVALIPITYQHANRVRLQEQTASKSSNTDQQIALEPSPQLESSVQLSPNPSPSIAPSGLPTVPPGTVNPVNPQFSNPNLIPGAAGVLPNSVTPPNLGTSTNKITAQNPASNALGSSGSVFNGTNQTSQPLFGINPPNSGNSRTTTSKTSVPPAIAFSNNATAGSNLNAGNTTGISIAAGNTRVGKTPANRGTTTSSNTGLTPNISQPYGTATGLTQLPPLSPIISSAPVNQRSSSTSKNPPSPTTADQKSQLVSRLREGRKSGSEIASANRSSSGTLFDTPQVAEARDFLKKRWRPPAGLKQTLEYSLIVGVDGSLERIYPLGKAATENIERTGMPRISERFVSPNRNGQSVRIRAVFSPDGQVQTLSESE